MERAKVPLCHMRVLVKELLMATPLVRALSQGHRPGTGIAKAWLTVQALHLHAWVQEILVELEMRKPLDALLEETQTASR